MMKDGNEKPLTEIKFRNQAIYTKHAQIRMQQRGIPRLVIDWLLLYGEESHDHIGGIRRYFTKGSIRNLRRDVGTRALKRFSEYLDCYLVEADGLVLTSGHRTKRIKHY